MGKIIDLTNQTFGKLIVIERASNGNSRPHWLCQCECGNNIIVKGDSLRSGNTKSCGCLGLKTRFKIKHGFRYKSEYKTWSSMLQRCNNSNHKYFYNYGGRGITVCEEWKNSFEAFYKDMGDRPEGTSLDRIDVNGNYELSNCRWATKKEQAINCRNTIKIMYLGETNTLEYFTNKYNIAYQNLYDRIKRFGWPIEKALTTPIRGI